MNRANSTRRVMLLCRVGSLGGPLWTAGIVVVGHGQPLSTATRCRCLRRFESFAVVTGSCLFLASAPVAGPVPDVSGGVYDGQDELGEQATDFVAGQRDQLAVACILTPFAASAARVTARNAAAAMARVMCAYQAS
jgi:hypothetical protein